MARESGRVCELRVDSNNSAGEVEEFIRACGPARLPGLEQLARAKGIPEQALQNAVAEGQQRERARAEDKARREREYTEMQAKRDERMAQYARENPGASYIPGQWESAIRSAGDAWTQSIKESSDNWLQQRRRQYEADWQRSQRAY